MASLPTYHHVARILTFVSLLAHTAADPSVDLQACLADIRTGAWGTVGGLDNHGHPISNISLATAISYPLCVKACGTGPEAFRWDTFSQQFGSWLLPWLALVSQLPFGTHSILQNFLSMMLAVGSPTLAAYSLVITVLNDRWVSRRFSSIQNPNSRNAVKVLTAFQQAPLVVTNDMHLLRSLVYLPENIDWWRKLALKLNYTHTWTISAGTSVAWVIIAYVFTVVDSLQGDITEAISAHGQGIGAIWLWLLPIVTGWLQTSPKCDTVKLYRAIRNANSRAHTITENFGTVLVDDIPDAEYALSLSTTGRRNGHLPDELCTAPIYNFSRHFSWSHSVEKVARTFETSLTQDPITALKEKSASEPSGPGLYDPDKTTPTLSRWAPGVFSRVFVASLAALFLQWGTTGGAMVINYHTPTYGIGCRTGSYLLYGSVGTLSWLLLILSTFLSHYTTTTIHSSKSTSIARRLSTILRWLGHSLAFCNAIWIVLACVFQFVNFFDRCWCNSSIISLGDKAYNVIEITWDEVPPMRVWWIIGVTIAAGSASLYALFVSLFIKPRLPR